MVLPTVMVQFVSDQEVPKRITLNQNFLKDVQSHWKSTKTATIWGKPLVFCTKVLPNLCQFGNNWEAREKVMIRGLKRMSSSFRSLKWLGKSKIHGYQSRNLRAKVMEKMEVSFTFSFCISLLGTCRFVTRDWEAEKPRENIN